MHFCVSVSIHWLSRSLCASKRRLVQQLNEKLLRSELHAIDEVVRDSRVRPISVTESDELIQRKTLEKARRMTGISRRSEVNREKVQKYSDGLMGGGSCDSSEPAPTPASSSPPNNPLDNFQSMKHAPRYQDLTHGEIRRMQELGERRKMFERKIQWLKNNQILDPVRVVNKEMRLKRKEEHRAEVDKINTGGAQQDWLPKEEVDPGMANKIRQIEFKMERDTAISRMRSEVRKTKLANSILANAPTPNIGNVITDPLKRHLNRRRVRVSLLLQQYLEEILTCNSAQVLLDHLGGAGVSVDRVVAPSTRGVHNVYVRVSTDHDPKWVQQKLNVLAPKLRSQLAVRVNYGYTPELKFHVLHDVEQFDKARLLALADSVKSDMDRSIHRHFLKEMNWK